MKYAGITETTIYRPGKDGRLRVHEVRFRCFVCEQTWTDPKGRGGDTVAKHHWKTCGGEDE